MKILKKNIDLLLKKSINSLSKKNISLFLRKSINSFVRLLFIVLCNFLFAKINVHFIGLHALLMILLNTSIGFFVLFPFFEINKRKIYILIALFSFLQFCLTIFFDVPFWLLYLIDFLLLFCLRKKILEKITIYKTIKYIIISMMFYLINIMMGTLYFITAYS